MDPSKKPQDPFPIPTTYQLVPTHQSTSTNLELNLMPFSINHHGESEISTYFIPTKSDNKTQESSFRGRYIHGTTLDLPNGYYGTFINTPTNTSNQALVSDLDGQGEVGKLGGRPSRSTGINQSKRHHKKTKLETKSVPHYEQEEEEEEPIQESLQPTLLETSQIKPLTTTTKTLELVGQFDKLILWNPDGPLDLKDNYLINGLDRFIGLSEIIHGGSD
ncbi:uncharacterized protein MELLADRAFT_88483 [Melampsora larici-populina 98AG31]|uniref:Uncharacterized protein n=1 Tax=Melampsora larici-populina (strain 98AG31 / pathotype 3-4-7) TaxID=747676 RepID=F4RRW1_MELLP|nr:uncharacterized protein MELLADRAFT_88483 [Melampsora larici-populina 98AG31]EGG04747.1 hypothetical protein MELLADRAFT_88483 [Melampsora larici-populina 98AG31]